jgi:hypothetical protein
MTATRMGYGAPIPGDPSHPLTSGWSSGPDFRLSPTRAVIRHAYTSSDVRIQLHSARCQLLALRVPTHEGDVRNY